jgi:DNA-binding PadR family transcriptional regulator
MRPRSWSTNSLSAGPSELSRSASPQPQPAAGIQCVHVVSARTPSQRDPVNYLDSVPVAWLPSGERNFIRFGDAGILRQWEYSWVTKSSNPNRESNAGPLSEAMYLVLASLVESPTHGYEIIGRANLLSDRRVTLPVATLYGTLDRLTLRGHIELVSEEVVDGRARRTYALTDSGHRVLDEETQRMSQLVSAMAKRQRTKRPRSLSISTLNTVSL